MIQLTSASNYSYGELCYRTTTKKTFCTCMTRRDRGRPVAWVHCRAYCSICLMEQKWLDKRFLKRFKDFCLSTSSLQQMMPELCWLEDGREDCSALCCVSQLWTVISILIWAAHTSEPGWACWFGFLCVIFLNYGRSVLWLVLLHLSVYFFLDLCLVVSTSTIDCV